MGHVWAVVNELIFELDSLYYALGKTGDMNTFRSDLAYAITEGQVKMDEVCRSLGDSGSTTR
jgi:hypothetical protein